MATDPIELHVVGIPQPQGLPPLVSSKISVGASGCWEWTGARNGHGYGAAWTGGGRASGRVVPAHRIVYEIVVGPIPDGAVLDHLCRTRHVRPDHLEVTTHRENILRGVGATAKNAVKVSCPEGHPYEGDNVYLDAAGRRRCRTCRPSRLPS